MRKQPNPYYRHRFTGELISHGVWLYHVLSLSFRGIVSGDNQSGCRVASFRNAPERVEHCLIRMLPRQGQIVNRGSAELGHARGLGRGQTPLLSCSTAKPAFPSRPGGPSPRRATEGTGGAEPPGATRSALFAREHGEDGEHRTFPDVSTVAD
jgi:hypothetical protein